ncbi:ABC transporter substrate-binding protein [Methanophagales archaeon]|nr:MAG: ABC transporter substrate-binding protein [Methanophagales archaeon]
MKNKNKNKQIARVAAVSILVVSLLTGFSVASAGSETAKAEEVIYTIADSTGDWGYPSPHAHYPRGPGYVRMSFIFDTLVWKDTQGFVPALATDWKYLEDENAYLFHLRKDVTWHDGEKFTAEDVSFTFNYTKEHPSWWVDLKSVKQVEVLDEYTVKIYLKEPYAPFLNDDAGTLAILPKHIWQDVKNPSEFVNERALIGTGPFKLVDYSKAHGTYLYEANEEYYLGKPAIDRLKFVKVSEEMAPRALMRGEVNATNIPPETVEEVNGKGFTVINQSGNWNAKLMINHEKEPMASKEFRHALAYAINRTELVEIAQRGHAIRGSPGLLSPNTPYYNPNIVKYEYNPQRAKDILESQGYQLKEDGYYWKEGETLELELITAPRFGFERVAEIIARQLGEAGIKVSVRSLEWKTLDSRVISQQFDLAVSGHGGIGGDPSILNKVILGKFGYSANYTKNESLNQLLEAHLREMDAEKRKEIVREIQKIYAEELPALTLYYPKWYWGHDGSVDIYYTMGGIARGIPIPLNKLAFMEYQAKVEAPTPAATEAPIPGFEPAISLPVLITVAYLIKRRRKH